MPRQPRSKSKTTPEFDPGELADLIHTPAVGTGVASHLLDRHPLPPLPTSLPQEAAAAAAEMTTVHMLPVAPVVTTNLATVATVVEADTTVVWYGGQVKDGKDRSDLTTVVGGDMAAVANMATVVGSNLPTVGETDSSTVSGSEMTTVDNMATVVKKPTVDILRAPYTGPLWVSEDGSYVPPKKVRPVRFAQDALSSAEQAVYGLLWNQPGAAGSDPSGSRLVQAGYDFIVKRTSLSKKTVQRIVAKLIDKDFIAIEIPADIYSRTSTTYRVFGQQTVLARMTARNRLFVAKVGPGVVHVRQMRPAFAT